MLNIIKADVTQGTESQANRCRSSSSGSEITSAQTKVVASSKEGLSFGFLTACIVLFPICVLCGMDIVAFHRRQQQNAEAVSSAQYFHLCYAVLFCGFYSFLRVVTKEPLRGLADRHLSRGKWSDTDREARKDKFATVTFKFSYMICVSVAAWYLLGQESWFQSGQIYAGFPHNRISYAIQLYYWSATGYALHSFVFHAFVTARRSDFEEMLLHHIVTLLLLVGSYFSSLTRIGIVVQFFHDVPDVFVYGCKAFVDTPYTVACLTMYASLVGVWAYMRLYLFPLQAILPSYESLGFNLYAPLGLERPAYFLLILMCVLLILHIYWFCLFLYMGYGFLTNGKTVDEQDKAKKAE